jgi:aminotransferase
MVDPLDFIEGVTVEELEAIADVLRGTDICVLSDEIYSELTYGDTKHVSIATLDGMKERTVIINGFSKTYSMTGWRMGYACGPAPIIAQMTKVHQFAIMSAPTTSQYAAIEAVRNGDGDIEKMLGEYDMRRRLMVGGFNKIGMTCSEPKGAFYAFPSIKVSGMDSEIFCEALLREKKVALVPGNAFGASGEGFVRASYCYSTSHIKEALSRIEEFLRQIK